MSSRIVNIVSDVATAVTTLGYTCTATMLDITQLADCDTLRVTAMPIGLALLGDGELGREAQGWRTWTYTVAVVCRQRVAGLTPAAVDPVITAAEAIAVGLRHAQLTTPSADIESVDMLPIMDAGFLNDENLAVSVVRCLITLSEVG